MSVSVAEYLGQRTDIDSENIIPLSLIKDSKGKMVLKQTVNCPFQEGKCSKVAKGQQPVCSIRKETDSSLWIVCEHRLCSSTQKKAEKNPSFLTKYQADILWQIATTVYRGNFERKDILINREVNIPIVETNTKSRADYILRNRIRDSGIDEILLEMQGGGETSNTKEITNHVRTWSQKHNPTNEFLRSPIAKVGTILTNAWRRQQEQLLVKGSIVNKTGGRIALVMGQHLYDLLDSKVPDTKLNDLREHNWTLCLLAFKEVKSESKKKNYGPIPLVIDEERLKFVAFSTFVSALGEQGSPQPSIFKGKFISLDGEEVKL